MKQARSRAFGALLCTLRLAVAFGVPDAASDDVAESMPEFELGVFLGPESEPKVDRIRVLKSERRLVLLSGEHPVYEYEIALGGSPIGPKKERGDERTPEGEYVIDSRKSGSSYHLALHISYPNADDRIQARGRGVEPGGAIMIHGLPNGFGLIGAAHRVVDWTDGCIAVTNDEIEEIWRRVENGVPIEIRP
jgi:murein L,D-transpeptidase YafK